MNKNEIDLIDINRHSPKKKTVSAEQKKKIKILVLLRDVYRLQGVADTLKKEYFRDLEAGIKPAIPENYFPGDDPTKEPIVSWRSCAHLLYANWLNYYVYQSTPYDLADIQKES